MDAAVKFAGQTQGRDRVFRATQYACALAIHLLRNCEEKEELVAKLKSLETNISAGRKLLRLGNTTNAIVAAQQSVQLPDRVLRLCLTAANVSRAFYFVCDNVLWAHSVGLLRGVERQRWSLNASRCYLCSLALSLTRDFYVILQLALQKARDPCFRLKTEQQLYQSPQIAEPVIPALDAFVFLLLEVLRSHPAVTLDAVKNLCDIFIPLDKLGLFKSSAGVVGLCGLTSSLIGILTLTKASLRIKP